MNTDTMTAPAAQAAPGAIAAQATTSVATPVAENLSASELARKRSRARRQTAAPSQPAKPQASPAAAATPATTTTANEAPAAAAAGTESVEQQAIEQAAVEATQEQAGGEGEAGQQASRPAGQQEEAAGEEAGERDSEGASGRPEWLEQALAEANLPDGKKKLVTRIHDVVDQRDMERNARLEAERQLAEMRATKSQAPEHMPQVVDPTDQFAASPDVQRIDRELGDLERRLAWCDRNPDGTTVETKDGPVTVTPEDIINYRRNYERQLTGLTAHRAVRIEHLRQQFQQQRDSSTAQAIKAYPWMNDKSSPLFQEALQVARDYPGVTMSPRMLLDIGDFMAGRRARLAAAGVKTAGLAQPAMTRPKATATPAPVVTRTATTAPRVNPLQKAVNELEAQYRKTGSVKDKIKLASMKRQLQSQAA